MLFFDDFKGSREDAASTGFLCTDVDKALTVQFRDARNSQASPTHFCIVTKIYTSIVLSSHFLAVPSI